MSRPKKSVYKSEDEILAKYAKALGHPARLAIIRHLASFPNICFTEILNELPISQSTVSQHLKELKDAGLIKGCIELPKVYYCIDKDNLKIAKKLISEL